MEEKINTRFRYIRLNRHPIGVLVTQDAGNNNDIRTNNNWRWAGW